MVSDIDLKELKSLILEELKKIEPEFMPKIVIKEITHSSLTSSYKFTCNGLEDIPRDIKQVRINIIEKNKKKKS